MTIKEARDIVNEFDERDNPSEDDIFLFTEAMNFLIEEERRPQDMMYLGGYYYELKNFDLALKYYEMAATYDYDPAYECLGYVWYYGRTGTRDFCFPPCRPGWTAGSSTKAPSRNTSGPSRWFTRRIPRKTATSSPPPARPPSARPIS